MTKQAKPLKTINDLAGWERNPRRISDDALHGLTRSLVEFGDLSGVVWNSRTGRLVCGHQRVRALREKHGDLPIEDGAIRAPDGKVYPVRVVDWDEVTEKAANVAANSPTIAGEFTEDLHEIIEELRDEVPELVEDLGLGYLDTGGGLSPEDVPDLGDGEIADKEQMARITLLVPRHKLMQARKDIRVLVEALGGTLIE